MDANSSVALVTGAGSGLGAATARRLAATGMRVVVVDRDGDRGGAVAGEVGGTFVQADVSDGAALEAAVRQAGAQGPLRVAVACAGVGWAARTVDRSGAPHDLAAFQKVIAVNLVGTFNLLRLAASEMARSEPDAAGQRGVVVQTASVAAFEGQIGQIAYAASKGGVAAMTLPAARDLAPIGVRVVTIAPGLFDTPLLGMLPEEARAALGASVVFPRRLGDPAEYASLVEHIVQNPYLNGETIRLDGALRMQPK
ncbi:MAG TPA: SDR family NAD(P)-dependent oxidoreductase [Kofleriaceae bacterium]|nr:SDR family NAD(P)-dependent oxidoreductase [Kofleriaceae bacterium]